jgi:hypothetical protein
VLPSNQRWFPGRNWWPMRLRGWRDSALVVDVEGPSTGFSLSFTHHGSLSKVGLLLWCCLGGRLKAQGGFGVLGDCV